MSKTHWKKLTNPDYLGAYALEPGREIILTLKSVVREIVTGTDGKKEECSVAHFIENTKPMILNATNSKTIQKLYKTPYIEEWAGKQIQIYVDPNVRVGKEVVEALRIRPFVPKPASGADAVQCVDCGDSIQPVGGKSAAAIAKYTNDKYGRALCGKCAEKAKNDADPLAALAPPANDTSSEEVEML